MEKFVAKRMRWCILGFLIITTSFFVEAARHFHPRASPFEQGRNEHVFLISTLNEREASEIRIFIYEQLKNQYVSMVESLDYNFQLHLLLILLSLSIFFHQPKR